MKLSLKFRLLRHVAGLDQHQAAEKLNVTVSEYSEIESGRLKANEDVFDNLLLILGIEES